jgi:hypothetical protein
MSIDTVRDTICVLLYLGHCHCPFFVVYRHDWNLFSTINLLAYDTNAHRFCKQGD